MDADTRAVLQGADPEALLGFIRMALAHEALSSRDLLSEIAAAADPVRAEAMAEGLVAYGAEDPAFWLSLLDEAIAGRAALSLEQVLEALDRVACQAGPGEGALRETVMEKLGAVGFDSASADFADRSAARPALTSKFWHYARRAYGLRDRGEDALAAAKALSAFAGLEAKVALPAARLLIRAGLGDDASRMIAASPSAQADPEVAALPLPSAGGAPVTRLERSLSPSELARQLDLEMQRLSDAGEHGAAAAVYDDLPERQRTRTRRVRQAQALEKTGDLNGAIALMRPILDADPGNAPLRRRVVGLHARAGRTEEARAIYAQGLSGQRADLSADLSRNLAEILGGTSTTAIPAMRVAWFSRVQVAAGHELAPDWVIRANRLARIDHLIVDWAQCYPDNQEDLFELVDVSPEASAQLDAALAMGKGAFIAAAHVGMLYSGPIALNKLNKEFAFVASVPDLGQSGMTKGLISTSTLDLGTVGRRILRALRSNAAVAIAIDGAGTPGSARRSFFGATIRLSDFTPRLAYRTGAPSFFPQITLPGERAQFALDPLPMAEAGEEEQAFVDRWLDTYVERLEAFLSAHPEAIRGTGGLWTKLTQNLASV